MERRPGGGAVRYAATLWTSAEFDATVPARLL
jgi:hypothetical protein